MTCTATMYLPALGNTKFGSSRVDVPSVAPPETKNSQLAEPAMYSPALSCRWNWKESQRGVRVGDQIDGSGRAGHAAAGYAATHAAAAVTEQIDGASLRRAALCVGGNHRVVAVLVGGVVGSGGSAERIAVRGTTGKSGRRCRW
jgi:hypothetical protein